MKAAIYDKRSGRILRRITVPVQCLTLQVGEGEEFFLNCPDNATHIQSDKPVTIPIVVPIEDKIAAIRLQRDLKLMGCDWTQVPDSPLSISKRSEWAIYRQLLRDFPSYCDINNPVWPEPPK